MERQVDTMQDIKELKAKIDGKKTEAKDAEAEEDDLRKQLQDLDGLLEKLEDEAKDGAEVEPATAKALGEELRRLKEAVAERIQNEKKAMEAKAKAEAEAAAAKKSHKHVRKASSSPG